MECYDKKRRDRKRQTGRIAFKFDNGTNFTVLVITYVSFLILYRMRKQDATLKRKIYKWKICMNKMRTQIEKDTWINERLNEMVRARSTDVGRNGGKPWSRFQPSWEYRGCQPRLEPINGVIYQKINACF